MRTIRSFLAGVITLGLGLGCSGPSPDDLPPRPVVREADGGIVPLASPFIDPRVGAPVSTTLPEAIPPISGGTLTIVGGGHTAIVADPDRDRVVAVDLVARAVIGSIDLPRGAQPTRVIEDADRRVHVVLRGTGEILSFSPDTMVSGDGATSTRRAVCAMPRGIAANPSTGELVVACRGGELVTMPAAGGAPTSTVRLDRDLRDVLIRGDRVLVSTFRRAELLEVGADGSVLARTVPPAVSSGGGFVDEAGVFHDDFFQPGVAWRTISATTADGSGDVTVMVHQRSSDGEVMPQPGGYGSGMRGGCSSSIVESTITFFEPDGSVTQGPVLAEATLPVDVAISPGPLDQQLIVVVAAANESGLSSIRTYRRASLEASFDRFTCPGSEGEPEEPIANPTSAAFTDDGRLVVLQRDPGRITILRQDLSFGTLRWVRDTLAGGIGEGAQGIVTIGTEDRFDTGHAIFHGNSGAFLACASCHPEGGDDARTWRFNGIGPRRTPAMHGDLLGTEPFHWDGDMRDLSQLVHDVFTERMSGPELGGTQVRALGSWLDELPRPRASVADADAVLRGRTLFEGEAACASCHAGARLTSAASQDVGTGGSFQVPSLIGVADRLPVMHDGCATTLRDRFRPECGGDRHGSTAHLTDAQIDDLVAYLESI